MSNTNPTKKPYCALLFIQNTTMEWFLALLLYLWFSVMSTTSWYWYFTFLNSLNCDNYSLDYNFVLISIIFIFLKSLHKKEIQNN